mgnify:FL=1
MLHILDNDFYDMLEFISEHNTPEQIEEAEKQIPDKDDVQENSFALLREFKNAR